MLPESKGCTPAGRTALALSTAWAGANVTLWVMTPGLVQFTVSPTLQFTVAGTKIALGLFLIVTSIVAAARAGAAVVTPTAAMVWVKTRRLRDIYAPDLLRR